VAALQLSDVVEPLYVFTPGAPEALLINAWRQAARRFFRETRAWKVDPAVAVGATNAEYNLVSPYTGSEVFDLASNPKLSGIELDKMTFEQARARNFPASGTPAAVRMGAPGTMILMPTPTSDVSASLSFVRGVVQPTRDAQAIDDSVQRYFEFIEFGALEYVFRVPNQPWSDLAQSNGYRALFQEEIDTASHVSDMKDVPRTVAYGGY